MPWEWKASGVVSTAGCGGACDACLAWLVLCFLRARRHVEQRVEVHAREAWLIFALTTALLWRSPWSCRWLVSRWGGV